MQPSSQPLHQQTTRRTTSPQQPTQNRVLLWCGVVWCAVLYRSNHCRHRRRMDESRDARRPVRLAPRQIFIIYRVWSGFRPFSFHGFTVCVHCALILSISTCASGRYFPGRTKTPPTGLFSDLRKSFRVHTASLCHHRRTLPWVLSTPP